MPSIPAALECILENANVRFEMENIDSSGVCSMKFTVFDDMVTGFLSLVNFGKITERIFCSYAVFRLSCLS
jgi:hypothetical protein